MDSRIVLAVIGAPHGVRGWVWLNTYTNAPELLQDYSPFDCTQGDSTLELHLDELKKRGKRHIARFRDSSSRTDAEALCGIQLIAPTARLPALQSGEYYWFQLVGCRVENTQGDDLGEVVEMTSTGREDLMRVHSDNWDGLIPFAKERVIVSVDIERKLIQVNWDRGWN